MSQSTIAPQIHQALDAHLDFPAKVSLYPEFLINDRPDSPNLGFGELVDARIWVDLGVAANLLGRCATQAIDGRQPDDHPLVSR